MMIAGGCHCGAIRYEAEGDAITHALCHCTDCRRHAGAPVVGWTMYPENNVKVTKGTPKVYASSEHGRRHFCADCGTGLFSTTETDRKVYGLRVGSIRQRAQLKPRSQGWCRSAQPWSMDISALPRYEKQRPA